MSAKFKEDDSIMYNIIITVMYRTEAVFEFSYYSDNIVEVSTE